MPQQLSIKGVKFKKEGLWSEANVQGSNSWKIPHVWRRSLARSCKLGKLRRVKRYKTRMNAEAASPGTYMLSLAKFSTLQI